jgi:hypothetical protein
VRNEVDWNAQQLAAQITNNLREFMMIHSYKKSKWHVISIGQVRRVKRNNITEEFICCLTSCISPKNISQPTFIIHLHHIIETIVLLLHSTEIITMCLGTSFTKPKLSCMLIKFLQSLSPKEKLSNPPFSITNELKFLLICIPAQSFSSSLLLATSFIILLHLKNLALPGLS